MAAQNFGNHAKWVPPFHFFILPVTLINFGWSIYRWIHLGYTVDGFIGIVVAAVLFVGFGTARGMTLKVQDRVIRLEERIRFERVLPADLQARMSEFTVDQLVALRFASNSELPELARKVLDEKLNSRKEIKKMIKVWRPDFARA
ncbi:MAG TPA: DUF6526 family protein [Candidatus Acidoferrum sp.]|nr:DUF6526 family protein [Candidatus Acidoferrum sp.]